MKLFMLTCCNPAYMMDDKLSDAVMDALDPQGSIHLTFEGADKTVRDTLKQQAEDPDLEGAPPEWAPTWVETPWNIPELGTFRKWTFECEETGDVWLIREMPVFGTETFPE